MSAQDAVLKKLISLGVDEYNLRRFVEEHRPLENGSVNELVEHFCVNGSTQALAVASLCRESKKLTRPESDKLVKAIFPERLMKDGDDYNGKDPEEFVEDVLGELDLSPDVISLVVDTLIDRKLFKHAIQVAEMRPEAKSAPEVSEEISTRFLAEGDLESAAAYRPDGKLHPRDVESIALAKLEAGKAYEVASFLKKWGTSQALNERVVSKMLEKGSLGEATDVCELGVSPECRDRVITAVCKAGDFKLAFRARKELRPDKPLDETETRLLVENMTEASIHF